MVTSLRSPHTWKDFDWPLLGAALVLSMISLTEIYSATMNSAAGGHVYLVRQTAAIIAGLICLFVIASLDYHAIAEHIPWIYIGSVVVLLYTLVFGKSTFGTRGWIQFGSLSVQPAEIIKMVVVVALARYLSERHGERYMTLSQILKAGVIF